VSSEFAYARRAEGVGLNALLGSGYDDSARGVVQRMGTMRSTFRRRVYSRVQQRVRDNALHLQLIDAARVW
jgi:hypothetical protein